MVAGNTLIVKKAKYAMTVAKEFENNFEPLNGEKIEVQYKALNNSVLAISNYRVVFLAHRKFGSDTLSCIPLDMIKNVDIKSSFWGGSQAIISYEGGEIGFTPISKSTGLGTSAVAGALAAGGAIGYTVLKQRSKEMMLDMKGVLEKKIKSV
jgi:hypothetical protein